MRRLETEGGFMKTCWRERGREGGSEREREKEGGGRVRIQKRHHNIKLNFNIPYSWKYWWELNLAVEPKIAIARIILANLNLETRPPSANEQAPSSTFSASSKVEHAPSDVHSPRYTMNSYPPNNATLIATNDTCRIV